MFELFYDLKNMVVGPFWAFLADFGKKQGGYFGFQRKHWEKFAKSKNMSGEQKVITTGWVFQKANKPYLSAWLWHQSEEHLVKLLLIISKHKVCSVDSKIQ